MVRKQPFPAEADTDPAPQRASGRAPKGKREEPLPPTVPPPRAKRSKAPDAKTSGTRSRRAAPKNDEGGATVDEVVADLSRDPRRERD
jgi:hypothetical protein